MDTVPWNSSLQRFQLACSVLKALLPNIDGPSPLNTHHETAVEGQRFEPVHRLHSSLLSPIEGYLRRGLRELAYTSARSLAAFGVVVEELDQHFIRGNQERLRIFPAEREGRLMPLIRGVGKGDPVKGIGKDSSPGKT